MCSRHERIMNSAVNLVNFKSLINWVQQTLTYSANLTIIYIINL